MKCPRRKTNLSLARSQPECAPVLDCPQAPRLPHQYRALTRLRIHQLSPRQLSPPQFNPHQLSPPQLSHHWFSQLSSYRQANSSPLPRRWTKAVSVASPQAPSSTQRKICANPCLSFPSRLLSRHPPQRPRFHPRQKKLPSHSFFCTTKNPSLSRGFSLYILYTAITRPPIST